MKSSVQKKGFKYFQPTLKVSPMSRPWYVYGLEWRGSGRRNTYIGATVDLARRLRQHNGELAGGARRTTRQGRTQNGEWVMVVSAGPFAYERLALQVEWAWKRACRLRTDVRREPCGRLRLHAGLVAVLTAPAATSRAEPWPAGGVLHLLLPHALELENANGTASDPVGGGAQL